MARSIQLPGHGALGGGGPSLQAPRRHLLPARGRPCAPHSLCSVAQPARALCALRPRAAARPHSPAASSNSSGGGSRAARTGRAMVQRRRPQPQRRGARAGVGGAQSEGGGARAPRWPAYPSLTRPAAQSMQWTTRGRGPAAESGFAPAPPASCTSPPGGGGDIPGTGSRTLCAADRPAAAKEREARISRELLGHVTWGSEGLGAPGFGGEPGQEQRTELCARCNLLFICVLCVCVACVYVCAPSTRLMSTDGCKPPYEC